MADITHGGSSRSDQTPKGSGRSGQVYCLLVPVRGGLLLIPNATVSEIIGYTTPRTIDNAPVWILGQITWRNHHLPLISFESVNGGEVVSARAGNRVLVVNTLSNNSRLPYFGLVSQGIPQLRMVDPNVVAVNEKVSTNDLCVASHVLVNGQPAIIPNIDELEQHILASFR